MKICTGSSFRAVTDQISRIEQGFREHGHEIVESYEKADLVYINNAFYDETIDAITQGKLKKGAKVIFNVLDLCPQDPKYSVYRLATQLSCADAVTTISQFVHDDLLKRGNVESTIIYQPIKPVMPKKHGEPKYAYKYLFVGRVNDPCKRTQLAAGALELIGAKSNEIVTVGFEYPRYGGDYAGPVSDKMLADFYASVDFIMCPSKEEGLLLPAVEAMAAGKIPVLCKDLTTLEEFFPKSEFREYHEIEPTPRSLAKFILDLRENSDKMIDMKDRLKRHFDENWAEKLSPQGVAGKILEVYQQFIH